MAHARPSATKKLREQKRRERQQLKAEKRAQQEAIRKLVRTSEAFGARAAVAQEQEELRALEVEEADVTDLEAEEYLNPQALGAGAGALQQPNLQARNVVRAGVVAHAIAFGVLILVLMLRPAGIAGRVAEERH